MYRINPETDQQYVEEFRRRPVGRHSPGLMRVLNALRFDPSGRQIVLFCRKPFAEWQIADLPELRLEKLVFTDSPIFTDRDEAEWEIFRRRWFKATGQHLNQPFRNADEA